MPLYMMEWTNRDVSFVLANDREEAAFMLDAEGVAQAEDLVQVPHFKIRLAFDHTAMQAEQVLQGDDVSLSHH
jgi:hypothetical protein